MFMFKYRAINDLGQKISGKMQSDCVNTLLVTLKQKGLKVITIRKSLSVIVNNLELSIWAESIAQYLHAGMSIDLALTKITLKGFSNISNELASGKNLSQIGVEYQRLFGSTFVAIIKSCEQSGQLAEGFEHAARHYRFLHDIKQQILSKIYYPVLLLILILSVTGYFGFVVIPVLFNAAIEMNIKIPTITKVVMWIIQHYIVSCTVIISAITGFCYKWKWFFSKTIKCFELLMFFKTLGRLIECDIHITTAIESIHDVINASNTTKINKLLDNLNAGTNLSQAMNNADNFFTPICCNIIQTGEKTGNLSQACTSLEKIYEQELHTTIEKIMQLVQPILMLFTGCLFVIIVYAGIAPLYSVIL